MKIADAFPRKAEEGQILSRADIAAIAEAVKAILEHDGIETPEYGDIKTVCRVFDLKPSFVYQLLRRGQIRTALVSGRGSSDRGRRLFVLSSVREFLASIEDHGQRRAPAIPRSAELVIPRKIRVRKKT